MNTNIKKTKSTKKGLIQRLINISHLLSIDVVVTEKFCLGKCVCVLFTSLSCIENNLLPNSLGNRVKRSQI